MDLQRHEEHDFHIPAHVQDDAQVPARHHQVQQFEVEKLLYQSILQEWIVALSHIPHVQLIETSNLFSIRANN